MVDSRVGQAGVQALIGFDPDARIAEAGVYALASTGTEARTAQVGMYALAGITADVKIPQAGVYLLAGSSRCTTRFAQVWKITRTDGEIFRFTSKDTDWTWLGEEYKACDSLAPSASEAVSELDAAGSMDLSGALASGGIAKEELYAGLFDGAEVEAWRVPWAGVGLMRRLLKGTFGPVEQTDYGFKVELIGDGGKLMQTPLIWKLAPGCRWKFGDPVTCRVDLVPLTVSGTIDSANGLREFTDAARAEPAGYFTRGRVTFTSGANSGISAEIKDHASGGVFELWPRLPFALVAGVTYSMVPGCTNIKAASGGTNGCTAWDNLLRYGGFDKVPGKDKRTKAANIRTE